MPVQCATSAMHCPLLRWGLVPCVCTEVCDSTNCFVLRHLLVPCVLYWDPRQYQSFCPGTRCLTRASTTSRSATVLRPSQVRLAKSNTNATQSGTNCPGRQRPAIDFAVYLRAGPCYARATGNQTLASRHHDAACNVSSECGCGCTHCGSPRARYARLHPATPRHQTKKACK